MDNLYNYFEYDNISIISNNLVKLGNVLINNLYVTSTIFFTIIILILAKYDPNISLILNNNLNIILLLILCSLIIYISITIFLKYNDINELKEFNNKRANNLNELFQKINNNNKNFINNDNNICKTLQN
jgi:hypothetical protein